MPGSTRAAATATGTTTTPRASPVATSATVVSDDWMWPGPEWFDNDHPMGDDGQPATPETLPREIDQPD